MALFARTLVSKQKRRFHEEGFNLDLTYVTENIVAMGFPSESIEGLYRNPFVEVVRFLETRHKDHYKVYNLCSERSYDVTKFPGPVAAYPFEDHNAPLFPLIQQFCEDAHRFLTTDPRNMVAVHCKAGKGRTGVMICCYLLYCGRFADASAAMQFYGIARTKNGKGVTIPSQQRYIQYFGQVVSGLAAGRPAVVYRVTRRKLNSMLLSCVPKLAASATPRGVPPALYYEVFQNGARIHADVVVIPNEDVTLKSFLTIDTGDLPALAGDVKIAVYQTERKKASGSPSTTQALVGSNSAGGITTTPAKILFQFWFNPFFLHGDTTLHLAKKDLDKANKDKTHAIFPTNFQLTLVFEPPTPPSIALDDGGSPLEARAGRRSGSSSPRSGQLSTLRKTVSSFPDREVLLRKLIEQQLNESSRSTSPVSADSRTPSPKAAGTSATMDKQHQPSESTQGGQLLSVPGNMRPRKLSLPEMSTNPEDCASPTASTSTPTAQSAGQKSLPASPSSSSPRTQQPSQPDRPKPAKVAAVHGVPPSISTESFSSSSSDSSDSDREQTAPKKKSASAASSPAASASPSSAARPPLHPSRRRQQDGKQGSSMPGTPTATDSPTSATAPASKAQRMVKAQSVAGLVSQMLASGYTDFAQFAAQEVAPQQDRGPTAVATTTSPSPSSSKPAGKAKKTPDGKSKKKGVKKGASGRKSKEPRRALSDDEGARRGPASVSSAGKGTTTGGGSARKPTEQAAKRESEDDEGSASEDEEPEVRRLASPTSAAPRLRNRTKSDGALLKGKDKKGEASPLFDWDVRIKTVENETTLMSL